MGIRNDVQRATTDRADYTRGCVLLSQELTGITARQADTALRRTVPGWQVRTDDPERELSRWDLYVLWHYVTMNLPTAGRGANRAHGGPIFLPWHRMFLLRLEQDLQRVLNRPDFGLPYWDWASDRALGSTLWQSNRLGTNRGAVTTGAIGALRVRVTQRFDVRIGRYLEVHAPRPIERAAGTDPDAPTLPTKNDVAACLGESAYDLQPFDIDSSAPDGSAGLRNRLEGWRPVGPGLHNRVHVWIGGDMSPGTSPNDPVFYLNHCNADRIWEAWMTMHGRRYVPDGTANGGSVPGHNLDDPMVALLGASLTPAQVLDAASFYSYDNLDVAA